MDAYDAMRDFVLGLVGMISQPSGLWRIAGPFVLLGIVLRIVRWGYVTARGEKDFDELHEQGSEHVMGLQNRISYGRSYHHLRGQGFDDRELRRARHQRSGGRFRW